MGIKMLRLPGPGKNLFNVDGMDVRSSSTGLTVTRLGHSGLHIEGTATGYGTWNLDYPEYIFRSGDTVVLSYQSSVPLGNRLGFRLRQKSPDKNIAVTNGVPVTLTFNVDRIQLYSTNSGTFDVDFTNIQLEEGSTPTAYEPYQEYFYKPCVTGGRYKSATASDTTAYPKVLNGFCLLHLKDYNDLSWDNSASSTLADHKVIRNTAFFGASQSTVGYPGAIPGGKYALKGYCSHLEFINSAIYAVSKQFTHYVTGTTGTGQTMMCIPNADLGVTSSTSREDVVQAYKDYAEEVDLMLLVERDADPSVWDYVKDTVGNTFGYLNRSTLEYMPVYLATGTVDAVQTVVPYILKGGNT